MTATIDKDRWAETTFAMRTFDDAATWSTIGVAEDDTPRVYGDVSALAVGTPLEVRAVSVGVGTLAGDSALVWVLERSRSPFPAPTTPKWDAPRTGNRTAPKPR